MSHFFTLVLVPRDCTDIHEAVSELLAPYDENKAVTPYMAECWCVGSEARSDARAQWEEDNPDYNDRLKELRTRGRDILTAAMEHAHGEMDQPYGTFGTLVQMVIDVVGESPALTTLKEQDEALGRELDQHLAARDEGIEALINAHPRAGQAKDGCEDCGGAGEYETTYNRKSKWDWFQIGGRWTGVLGDYDPTQDPANLEMCWLCQGTGKRTDMKVPNGCNGCDGTGVSQKWPTNWSAHPGDIVPARELLVPGEGLPPIPAGVLVTVGGRELARDRRRRGATVATPRLTETPYALVTPDGEWHQRGDMGWFGMSSNDKPEAMWGEMAAALVEQHADTSVAVVCDLHI